MHDYLKTILDQKQAELSLLREELNKNPAHPIHAYLSGDKKRLSTKSFKTNVKSAGLSVIAEIKRRSPSKSHLANIEDPVGLARKYVNAGAAAISVLTDKKGFNGSLDDLRLVAGQITSTPVLRKDFTLAEEQIAEAIVAGADAILLIVAVLGEKTEQLLQTAKRMGIDALVEVHNKEELDYAASLQPDIIGINNRNLTTFDVDINTALQLRQYIPENIIAVAESGLHSIEDIQQCVDVGFDAVLIGEALVRADDPSELLARFQRAGL